MAKKKRIELVFEGKSLAIVKLTERNDQMPLREMLLSNSKQIRFVAVSEPNYPGSYSVSLYTRKGSRTAILNRTISFELSGLENDAKALISVDPESHEVIIHRW